MSMIGGSSKIRTPRADSFTERLESVFEELALSIRADRPSILLAPYASEFVRQEVEDRLEKRLGEINQQAIHFPVTEDQFDVAQLLARHPARKDAVFFITGLSAGGGREEANAYRALNIRRELLVDYRIRALFWLTGPEARDLSRFAPDFWAFRHRVVEFNREADINRLAPPGEATPLQQLRSARSAARHSLQSAEPRLQVANLSLKFGLAGAARQAYLKVLALEPHNAAAWLGVANAYRLGKNVADAIINYQQAIRLEPKSLPARLALIACLRLTGQAGLADEEKESALPLMQGADEYSRAAFASVSGNTPQAVELLRHALKRHPMTRTDLRHDPNLDFIRNDPAFVELAASLPDGAPRGK